jgi:MFS family permease
MFMVYQTIPILARASILVGFDGTILTSSVVLLPFTTIFLALSPFISKVVSKFGNLRSLIFAGIISLIGFVSIHIFHANEFHVGIISIGLALINAIAMNITLLLTPKQFGGVVVGIDQVFTFIGMAVGLVISGLCMQNFQTTIYSNQTGLIPSGEAYDVIFLAAAIASCIFVLRAFTLKKTVQDNIVKA